MSRDDLEDLYKSVVYLAVETSTGALTRGSGIIVSDDGYILTNHHVIEDATLIRVLMYDGYRNLPVARYLAEVLYPNPSIDAAILQITSTSSGSPVSSSTLRSSLQAVSSFSTVDVSDSIRVIGYPRVVGSFITNTNGDIIAFNNFLSTEVTGTVWISDVAVGAGSSGGLVTNCSGHMIGMPSVTRQDDSSLVVVVIPIDTICELEPIICEDYIQARRLSPDDLPPDTISPRFPPTACLNNGLPPRLEVGERGRVTLSPNTRSRIRVTPGFDGGWLRDIDPGAVFTVVEGPVCENDINWWKVETDSSLQDGWIAEGQDREYYLEPWN